MRPRRDAIHLPARRGGSVKWVLLAAGCVLLVTVLSVFDWRAVGGLLQGARYAWLPVVLLLTLVYFFLRSWRWSGLLRASWPNVPFWPLHAASTVSVALGNLTPVQGGEAAKVELTARISGISRVELAALFVLERILDLIVLGAVFLIGLTALAAAPSVQPLWIVALTAPLVVAAALLALLRRDLVVRMVHLLASYAVRPRVLARALAISVLSWAVVVLSWLVFAWFLRIDMSFLEAMALVGGVTFLRVLTFVPGGIGVDEAGIVGLMVLMGHTEPHAQAYALSGRLIDVAMILIAAAFFPLLRRRSDVAPTNDEQDREHELTDSVAGRAP